MLIFTIFEHKTTEMGTTTPSTQERFHSRYAFVQAVNDRNFGLVKIYRKRQLNFDYVMVFEQKYSSGQLSQAKAQIQKIRRNYTIQSDTALLKILNVEQISGSTCEAGCLRLYMQYLNYSLRDMILSRKANRNPFTPDEIMYVIQSAFNAYQFLKKLNTNHITLRPDCIYINPDGMVRFNPVRIDPFQAETQGCQCIPQNRQTIYQKSQRQFLYQLKSMVLDMVEICPQDDYYFKKNYELLANLNNARTLQQVKACLWTPQTDSLLAQKRVQTTEVSSVMEKDSKMLGMGLAQPFSTSFSSSGGSKDKLPSSDRRTSSSKKEDFGEYKFRKGF